MPYKIVKTFEKGNSKLSAVPSGWEQDGVLYWPRFNENKLRRLSSSCPESNWRKINCKVKRSNLKSLLEAEEELDKMCNNSETDTDTDQHINVASRINDSFENLVQDCITLDDILPEIPVLDVHNKGTSSAEPPAFFQPLLIQPQAPATQENVTTEIQLDNDSLSLIMLNKIETLNQNYKNLNDKINENIKAQQEDRKFINGSIESILRNLSNITVQFEHLTKQFSRVEDKKQKTNTQVIASDNDLKNFEKLLEDPEVEREMKKEFSIICGKGKGRGVNNAYALVDSMFDRSFLLQCSWSGGSRTSEQKICFKSHTKVINFFFSVVHESDPTFTTLECQNFFKNILKNSRQRNQSKQERTSRTKNRPKIKGKGNLGNENVGERSDQAINEGMGNENDIERSGQANEGMGNENVVDRSVTENQGKETSV